MITRHQFGALIAKKSMVSCFQEISLKFTMYNNFFLGCATRKIVVIILKNTKLPFEYFLQLCRFSRNMVL